VARQLFLEHGFEDTTVAQIAEAADVAQGTFFNHFPSKQAVLAEMTSEALDRITGFADCVAKEIAQARGLARDVLLELMRTGASAGEAYPYLERVHEPFTAILREGQAKGEVRADLDAAFLAEMVVGALQVGVTNWLVDPGYPLEERLLQTAAFIGGAIEARTESS